MIFWIAGYGKTVFCWDTYLRITKSISAPEELFLGRSRAAVGADSAVHGWKVHALICTRNNAEFKIYQFADLSNFQKKKLNQSYVVQLLFIYIHKFSILHPFKASAESTKITVN